MQVPHPDIDRVLLTAEAIAARVAELGAQVGRDLAGADGQLVIVPVMTGGFIIVADLVRHLPQRRVRIEVVTVSSYGGKNMTSRGSQLLGALPETLVGKHVLVVDDILDTGGTLRLLQAEILRRGAASSRSCVLLRKPTEGAARTKCDYVGFDIPDEFVVGYGLDYDGLYRNLPYVGTLAMHARNGGDTQTSGAQST